MEDKKPVVVVEGARLSFPHLSELDKLPDAQVGPFSIEWKTTPASDEVEKFMAYQKALIENIALINGLTYEQVSKEIEALEAPISAIELQERMRRKASQVGAPPRQLSSVAGHPWYNEKLIKGGKVGVRFNGAERKNDVMEYDADAGYIRVHIRDNKGNWKQSRGRFITVKLTGEVVPFWK